MSFECIRYFNSAGSKDGWTPGTFVSTRRDKQNAKEPGAQKISQRPEDFMDEEDLRDAEEARQLQTANKYIGFGDDRPGQEGLGGALMDLLPSSGETMGVKLLRRMGWKEGQGIGPRVRRAALLGTSMDDGDGQTHFFAPQNTQPVKFVQKGDTKGLGFLGEKKLSVPQLGAGDNVDDEDLDPFARLALKPGAKAKGRQPQLPRPKGGLGVGILNSDDDEDPYEIGPRISYNRVLENGKKKRKKGTADASQLAPTSSSKNGPVFISKRSSINGISEKTNNTTKLGFRPCHDGRLPLEGFLLSSPVTVDADKKYAVPKVPEGWTSTKQTTQKASSGQDDYTSTADAAKTSSHDPRSRAQLLGEQQLPGMSAFDFMTPETRQRMVEVTGRTDLPPALAQRAPKGYETSAEEKRRSEWSFVPHLERSVAKQALEHGGIFSISKPGSTNPYAEDEAKRSRYRSFLEMKAGVTPDKLPERPAGMNVNEWTVEMNEFVRVALIFRPATGLMASRFTSATTTPSGNSDTTTHPLAQPGKKLSTAEEAAKLGMYGQLTREIQPFSPSKLLCKRFGIRTPVVDMNETYGAHGTSYTGKSQGQAPPPAAPSEVLSKDTMDRILAESSYSEVSGQTGQPMSSQTASSSLMPHQVLGAKKAVDPEHNEALETEKAGADVFRAVFGDADDDDDEGGFDL